MTNYNYNGELYLDQALKREVSADVTTQPADNYNSGTADTNYILTNGVLLFHYQTDSNPFCMDWG